MPVKKSEEALALHKTAVEKTEKISFNFILLIESYSTFSLKNSIRTLYQ